MDSYGKRAGKGALIAEEISHTLGTSQDQYLFQAVGVDLYNQTLTGDVAKTLNAISSDADHIPCVISFEPGIAQREGGHIYKGVSGTLRAKAGDNQMAVAYGVENHPADSRVNIDDSGICQTLTSRMGTGGGNVPLVMFSKHRRAKFKGDFETWGESDTTNTLNTFDSGESRATDIIVCETYHCNTEVDMTPPIKARDYKDPLVIAIDRSTFNQGENAKYDISVSGGGTAYTIVARGPGAVCYPKLSEVCVQEITRESEISS